MIAKQLTLAAFKAAVFLSAGLILAGTSTAIAQDCNADVGVFDEKAHGFDGTAQC